MSTARSLDLQQSAAAITPGEVRAELSRILGGSEFRSSRRRRDLLAYLVDEMLAGRGHLLKGFNIAVSVFGRGEDFDAKADPVVRLEARRLRRDLASYYVAEGRSNPLRITIPKGHYMPEVLRAGFGAAERLPDHQSDDEDVPSESVVVAIARLREASEREAGDGGALRRRWAIALIAVLVFGACVFGIWAFQKPGRTVIEAPKLVVTPFSVLGNRPEDRFLAAGIADQIVTDLSRFPDLRLYLPSPATAVDAEDPLVAGRRQGMAYAVTGSVSSDGSAVRIAARLVELATGRVLWTADFERPFDPDSLLAIQGQISSAIASTLGQPYGVIQTDLTDRLDAELAPSTPSFECVLRAYAYRRNFDRAMHPQLMACLQQAVQRDPRYADAWAMLGWLELDAGRFGIVPDKARAYDEALDAATHAVNLDGKSIVSLKALASIDHYRGQFAESVSLQRQALALNPNDPDTLAQLGWRLAVRGNFDEGIPYLQQAIQRTLNPPGWYFHLIAIDDYMRGRYDDMLAAAKHGTADTSGVSWALVAIAYGALGDKSGAREALKSMAAATPRLAKDPAAVLRGHQAIEPIVTALVDGLRKAGWSEPTGL